MLSLLKEAKRPFPPDWLWEWSSIILASGTTSRWLLPKALLQDALLVFHPSEMHLFAVPTSLVILFSFHGVHAVSVVSAIDGDLSSVYFLFGGKLYDKPLLRQTVDLHALLTVWPANTDGSDLPLLGGPIMLLMRWCHVDVQVFIFWDKFGFK